MAAKTDLCILLAVLAMMSCKSNPSRVSATEPTAEKGKLGLNDVSILIPLTSVPAFRDRLPLLTGMGEKEAYLPAWVGEEVARAQNAEIEKRAKARPFDKTEGTGTVAADFSIFRLVALRVDPCANIRTAKTQIDQCLRQLRLIWQPLSTGNPEDPAAKSKEGPFTRASDANVHAIYQLSAEEFRTVLDLLRSMHRNASIDTLGLPLQPHPVLAKEGVESPYFKSLLSLVNRFARASQLTHVAHLAAVNNGNVWQLSLMAVKDGKLSPLPIPATQEPSNGGSQHIQTLKREAGNPTIDAMPRGTTEFVLSEGIDFGADPATREALAETLDKRILQNIYAIENPLLHDAENLDCASCHRAFGTFAFAQRRELKKGGQLEAPQRGYTSSKWDLSFTVQDFQFEFTGPWTLQMFSFFGTHAKVTPRVINESAEVLNFIEMHNQ